MITNLQPEFTGAASVYPWSQSLEDSFTSVNRFGEPIKMAFKRGNSLYVPRETVPLGKQDVRTHGVPKPFKDNFEPVNDEQGPLTDKSIALLKQGQSHIFESPTGSGKSVMGGHIACALGLPTLIVVNKSDLMDSWYDALVHVLGVPPKEVGKVQQDTYDWKDKRFVLAMIHSLVIPDKYPQEMYNYFGLMIVDEVDVVAAETFVNSCWLVPAALRLGLTATPDRGDGKWKVVTGHMGSVMVRGTMVPMKAKVLVQKTNWHIPTYRKFEDGSYVQTKIAHSPGRMMTVSKAMSMNQPRNMLIAEFAVSAYNAGRHCLILSDLSDHLDRLFQVITALGVSGENIGYYVGGMSKAELEITKKKKRIILGTYKMMETSGRSKTGTILST